MIKGLFVDFYGTLVHEDGEVIKIITDKIAKNSNTKNTSEIGAYWWRDFKTLFENSKGESFQTQRELEYISLKNTLEYFNCNENPQELSELMFKHWQRPPIFDDTEDFIVKSPVPIYIISNIDTEDICAAISFHKLSPNGVVTSEEAKSYKPQKELFEYALKKFNLTTDEVIHIGDSVTSDILGAKSMGIKTIWINRFDKPNDMNYLSAKTLNDVLDIINGGNPNAT